MSDKPEKIRVSIGSAMVLGLIKGMIDAKPTTIYLLTYIDGKCSANCAFCPQARDSTASRDLLSRVLWPPYKTEEVLKGLRKTGSKRLRRVCLQIINYPGFLDDVMELLGAIREATTHPISLDTPPIGVKALRKLQLSLIHI